MFESSYPLVFLAWFLGGFINGVSGMGAAMVALPIVACVLEMSEAVPATCLVAVTLAAVSYTHLDVYKRQGLNAAAVP